MLKRLFDDVEADEIEFDVTRFVFDGGIEPPLDKRYVTVPLFPESRSDAETT